MECTAFQKYNRMLGIEKVVLGVVDLLAFFAFYLAASLTIASFASEPT